MIKCRSFSYIILDLAVFFNLGHFKKLLYITFKFTSCAAVCRVEGKLKRLGRVAGRLSRRVAIVNFRTNECRQ